MFLYKDPPAIPDLQIDPQQRPLFQILQQDVNGVLHEVGYVWTVGTSRTSSTEHWYLYASAPTATSGGAAYKWAGYDAASGQIQGTTLKLARADVPPGQDPSTLKAYLERTHGVTVTYVRGTMSAS